MKKAKKITRNKIDNLIDNSRFAKGDGWSKTDNAY